MALLDGSIDDSVDVSDDTRWRYIWPWPARLVVDAADFSLDVDMPDEATEEPEA